MGRALLYYSSKNIGTFILYVYLYWIEKSYIAINNSDVNLKISYIAIKWLLSYMIHSSVRGVLQYPYKSMIHQVSINILNALSTIYIYYCVFYIYNYSKYSVSSIAFCTYVMIDIYGWLLS